MYYRLLFQFQQKFSYIYSVSFIVGGNCITRKHLQPTKSLELPNFIGDLNRYEIPTTEAELLTERIVLRKTKALFIIVDVGTIRENPRSIKIRSINFLYFPKSCCITQ